MGGELFVRVIQFVLAKEDGGGECPKERAEEFSGLLIWRVGRGVGGLARKGRDVIGVRH